MAKKQTRRLKSTKTKAPKRKANKSPKRKGIRKSGVKKRSISKHNAKANYVSGKQDLSISYSNTLGKFVFTLTNDNGKLGSVFQIDGSQLMKTMSMPSLVTSSI